ncbi:hypothetical protein DPMN_036488 [Dreissena polymorpha]|uniref:Uncharacterized protein n=1 Tax=Dreissena polymorpha TaxID=45954 RepID=A0A9D4MAZ7_DREPO|nr:hypothetical protein DPMN_036488 [Dreissena polymorpha]
MCKSDECCVSDYGIVGQNEGPGSCQTMGKPGDSKCCGFMISLTRRKQRETKIQCNSFILF